MKAIETAVEVLRYLEVKRIKLLTNNPEKVNAFDKVEDIEVVERVPLQVGIVPENEEYLEAKRVVKGHFFTK